MNGLNIDGWIDSYKVRVFPWIDGKHIYCNVQYYNPGQPMSKGPVLDNSVLIEDTDAGRHFVIDRLHTLVRFVGHKQIKEGCMGLVKFNKEGQMNINWEYNAANLPEKQESNEETGVLTVYVLERENPDDVIDPKVFADKKQALSYMMEDYAKTRRDLGIADDRSKTYGYECTVMLSEKDGNGSICIQSHSNLDRYSWHLTAHTVSVRLAEMVSATKEENHA